MRARPAPPPKSDSILVLSTDAVNPGSWLTKGKALLERAMTPVLGEHDPRAVLLAAKMGALEI